MTSEPQPTPVQNEPRPYPAEKARGGEIILRSPQRRIIFIAGLVGAMLVAVSGHGGRRLALESGSLGRS